MVVSIIVLGLAVQFILKRLGPEEAAEPNPGRSWLKGLAGEEDENAREDISVRSGSLYRWRDANGTLHIESRPPSSDIPFETIEYATPVKTTTPETSGESSTAENVGPQLPETPVSVYTPDGISELLERVDETAKKIEEREQLLNELEDEL